MPKSNGRPKNRQRKTPKRARTEALCVCGGKATRYGVCVRCLDSPLATMELQARGVYLPSRKQRRTYA